MNRSFSEKKFSMLLPFVFPSGIYSSFVIYLAVSGVEEVEPSVSGWLHEKTRAKDFPFPAGK
ncbi:MAG: hypothetical protein LBT47_05575 [Deltaproteobacteria bacterium]|jgi:hypothetical protein|nr:hypothetical protein [Deltaproteobacteria bacterium]